MDRQAPANTRRGRIGLVVGPAVAAAVLVTATDLVDAPVARAGALLALMAVWWITEPVPIAVTSLLPIVAIPLLGLGTITEATAPYASPIIFLFLGGFLLAAAVQRWRLHERIAYRTALLAGTTGPQIVGGFMVATAVLSMWISNTAAALLMLPMGASIVALAPDPDGHRTRLGHALFLGIAYAASIGGLATLVGSPPNAFAAAHLESAYGVSIGFAGWMALAAPVSVLGLVLVWAILVHGLFRIGAVDLPGGQQVIIERLHALGPVGPAERRVGLIFVGAAAGWILGPQIPWLERHVSDPGVAIAAGVLLFLVPSGTGRPLLDWNEATAIPWHVLLLFGGGLSLAGVITTSGLGSTLGDLFLGAANLPLPLLVLVVAGTILVLTEFTSNTATAAALVPVAGAAAVSLGHDASVLVIPAALAASCAFMLPVATPPNAVVYATGAVSITRMVRTGIWFNVLFLAVLTLHASLVVRAWSL